MWKALAPLAIFCLSALTSRTAAQELPPSFPTARPRPEAHVIDDAHLFTSEPARLAEMERRLADLEARRQFKAYVVIHDTLIGTDAWELSQQLQDDWIGRLHGCVIVVEADSGNVALGIHPVPHLQLDAVTQVPDIEPLELSLLEQDSLCRVLQHRTAEVKNARARAETVAFALNEELEHILVSHLVPPQSGFRLRVVAFIVGIVCAAGLLALVAVAWLRRTDTKARQRYIFPEVGVGIRLGAPYGGGKMASISFGDGRRNLPNEPPPVPGVR